MQFFGLIMLVILIYVYVLIKKPGKNIKQISTSELKTTLRDKNRQFIDVRSPGEYNHGHIKPFKNMPLQSLHQTADTLNKDKEIIVICQSGMRSANACKILKKKGFTSVTNVKGGMNSWSH